MPVTLRLTNTGREQLTVYLQGRPIAFDLTVRHLDGTIVWRRLEGQVVSAILAVRQLEPGASLEFEEVWRQVSNTGETRRRLSRHRRASDRRAGTAPDFHGPGSCMAFTHTDGSS